VVLPTSSSRGLGSIASKAEISLLADNAGAALYRILEYSGNLTAVGDQIYSDDQTIRNMNFTGSVRVTCGRILFESVPLQLNHSARISPGVALQQHNGGDECGTMAWNWCDFDSGLRGDQGNFETEAFNADERTNQSLINRRMLSTSITAASKDLATASRQTAGNASHHRVLYRRLHIW
jgi:hypothetical protein